MNARWRTLARVIASSLIPTHQITLCARPYRVLYEARKSTDDRDYLLLEALANDNHCVFDVGANMGLTTLVMSAALEPGSHIYTFDASEVACHIIQQHVSLNRLSETVTVVNAVVAERSGMTLDFYGMPASGGASTIQGYLGHYNALQKATLALDDFVENTQTHPDFIKIDVEGAEYQVLQGLQRVMMNLRPLLMIELHSWHQVTVVQNVEKILPLIHRFDYELVYMRTKQTVKDPEIFSGRGRTHALVLPQERPLPAVIKSFDTSQM